MLVKQNRARLARRIERLKAALTLHRAVTLLVLSGDFNLGKVRDAARTAMARESLSPRKENPRGR